VTPPKKKTQVSVQVDKGRLRFQEKPNSRIMQDPIRNCSANRLMCRLSAVELESPPGEVVAGVFTL